jgi:arginase
MRKEIMKESTGVRVIGVVSGLGAGDPGCSLGPIVLKNSPFLCQPALDLNWENLMYVHTSAPGLAAIPAITELCERIAAYTYQYVEQRHPFVIVGGDHSCAIGTWSGGAAALQSQGAIGLLWIDAHMDSHTPQTTPSNNMHGMPLACLLGYGDTALTNILSPQPKLQPKHVCLIGVHSFEAGEAELLEKLKVRVYFMDEVRERGLQTIFQEALNIVQRGTVGYGVSIDIDAIDPLEAPGVSAPAPGGIKALDLYNGLDLLLNDTRLVGVEIVEFNPNRDQDHKTEKIVADIFCKVISYANRLQLGEIT